MSNPSQEDKISTLNGVLNLANLALSSGVLDQAWDAITETKDQLSGSDLTVQFKVKELTKCNIIVFVTPPVTPCVLLEKTELVTLSKSATSGFDFLHSTRKKSSFSINKAALSLFGSREEELLDLVAKIAKAANSNPCIITVGGIGGSVACLFALRLLSSLDMRNAKPPLCVTFGSPLLGDHGLQKAISDYTWDSCFLHVVSMNDCLPSLFVRPKQAAGGQTVGDPIAYYPFGRFMFCSNSGGACFEVPESALIPLRKINAESGRNEQSLDYGLITANLRKGLICEDKINLSANGTGSSGRGSSVAARYLSGLFQLQDIGENSQLESLLKNELSKLGEKRCALKREPRELTDIKVYMAYMEWYKKTSEKDKIPYYDSYKNQSYRTDFTVNRYKRNLQNYWERKVKEAEDKPQKAEAALRVRWLFGGTNYRRIVEPLQIADYYKCEGARGYIKERRSEGRLKHYKLLEEWLEEDQADKKRGKRQKTAPPSPTEDSCFWAHVEEAMISCQILNEGESAGIEIDNLKKFEEYVLERINKYEVSSDIFWERSSFMKWWKNYEKILDKKLMGTSYTSPLFKIMHNCEYKLYEGGKSLLNVRIVP